MTTTEEGLRAALEPAACRAMPYTDGTLIAASQAVSLKRIADALANEGHPRGDLLHWLEQLTMDVRGLSR